MNRQNLTRKPVAPGGGRGIFVVGIREGDFVIAYYRDPNGDPINQTKAFRGDASEVAFVGDITYDEDAFRGVRLERFWHRLMSAMAKEFFHKVSGVKEEKELVWPQVEKATLETA